MCGENIVSVIDTDKIHEPVPNMVQHDFSIMLLLKNSSI
jgi:hypothetical protein